MLIFFNFVFFFSYSDNFRDCFDYFRAVLKSNEKSQRVLSLTEDAISHNSSNYTVWWYRRAVLKFLKYDLFKELEFVDGYSRESPKNYQVWFHRRWLISEIFEIFEISNDVKNDLFESELLFTEECLMTDAKNYNVWGHRQFLTKVVLKLFVLLRKNLKKFIHFLHFSKFFFNLKRLFLTNLLSRIFIFSVVFKLHI